VGARYTKVLDRDSQILLWVDFTTKRGKVVDYVLVLMVVSLSGVKTVRIYDSAHGYNEMHRYTTDGEKQPGERFHSGTLGEGMRVAIKDVEDGHLNMIEGWSGRTNDF